MSNQVALDPGQIVERHMRELHGEFISLMSNQKNELLLRVNDLEKQIRDSSIINDYLQRQNRDVVNELDKTKNELVEHTKAADRRVVCLIDGDGTIFSLSQIAQGVPGGRSVAAKLTEAIRQYLPSDQFQLHVWLYFNKRGLSETLRRCDRRDAADGLEAFVWGFNQAAERFMMVDVGAGKEVVDAKVKAYLEDEIKASQTIKVIFSGCHDTGYLTTIRSIITGGYEQKLVLMPGYAEMAAGFYALNLPTLIIPELFEPEKFNTSTSTFPLVPPGLPTDQARPRSITTSSAGSPKLPQSYTAVVQTPATPGAYRRSSPTQRKARHIDPSKPLTKRT
ncbi:hypothetical protein EW026_g6163 [Hermanssonia centrifuga]|uniref:DUF7923 domain-containing protein n=1 Tax=Hermanssonia centrifuga TaxID=98765 RepID=A0A4S4KBX4_9APHY|nr:hypothetical protein EW026_g6163 [Hermanssonia centrifuga]